MSHALGILFTIYRRSPQLFFSDTSCCLQYQQAFQLQQVSRNLLRQSSICSNQAPLASATMVFCAFGIGVYRSHCKLMSRMTAGMDWSSLATIVLHNLNYFCILVVQDIFFSTSFTLGVLDSPSILFTTSLL